MSQINKTRIGIIAEYNPFHNGHIYQFSQIKQKWPDSDIIIILSGKYVQRGEIAVASFEQRKKIALEYGAKEVYELDFFSATQAAHIFAQGAVTLANQVGIDILVFGSETDNIDLFIQAAKVVCDNEKEFFARVKKVMKTGVSFPKANQMVLEQMLCTSFVLPNDILGFEYVKSIIKNNYPIQPFCFKRSIGFHSMETIGNIASATYIRSLLYNQDEEYQKYTPMRFKFPIEKIEDYFQEFKLKVNSMSSDELKNIKMMSEGMENLFKKHINEAKTYEEFVNLTNSKRYTSSRIKRTMLYVLLDIKKDS